MRMIDLIDKKRQGKQLLTDEIHFIIQEYMNDNIPDYQMSAFLMAVCFNGMTDEEAADLTIAMRDSGETMDLSGIPGRKIDKHSSGGIGDKTTLVLAPIIASLGVPVSKMSGRGLGYTGGTIDKLESFPGFKTALSQEEFLHQVLEHQIIVSSQSGDLAPADRRIYALRDATATVESIPLIASSIMSKKLASGCDGIVLDVTCGDGAFMKKLEDAEHLSQLMISIGKAAGKDTVAVITSMEEPLGFAVGNILEVKEAIDALKGNGPEDLMEVVLSLGSHMLYLAKACDSTTHGRELIKEQIRNGQALNKFKEWISSQGGDVALIDHPDHFPQANHIHEIKAEQSGFIESIYARAIGDACMMLGGGRKTKEDSIDPTVGIVLTKKVGDSVTMGETMAYIYMNESPENEAAIQITKEAIQISENKVEKHTLILGELT